jgi:HD-like signal output (HDOD) protein
LSNPAVTQSRETIITPGAGIANALAEFTHQIAVELAAEAPELPGFPEVALRVRQALGRDDIEIEQVVRIVSVEPSLAVRLLQLANSVAMNPGTQRVTTLRAAIARIGFNLARSATIAFAMSQMRRADAWRNLEARFGQIWNSCARLAATSFALARHCGRKDADQALLAAMLSAVGKLFVLTRVSRFPLLLDDAALSGEIETVWQARAARALLNRWALSAEVLEAACECELAQAVGEGPASLSDVLLAARYLVGVRAAEELSEVTFLGAAPFRRLDLDARGAADVLAAAEAEIASLRAALAD